MLWRYWWNLACQLRPACSRMRTFLWILIANVLGFDVPIDAEIIQTVTVAALIIGVMAFMGHRRHSLPHRSFSEPKLPDIKRSMAALYKSHSEMKRGPCCGTHPCAGLNRQAPVARFEVWVGLFHSSGQTRFQQTGGPRVTYVYGRVPPPYEGIPNAAYRQKEVLMPLQSEPAQETQIDWHEVCL